MKYEEIEAMNWSTLKLIETSPALLKHFLDHPEEQKDKDAYRLGRACHCAILEPLEFNSRYIVQPDFGPMNTNAAKEKKLLWLVEAGNLSVPEMDLYGLPPGKALSKQIDAVENFWPSSIEIISKDEHDAAWRCADAIDRHDEASELLKGGQFEQIVEWVDPDTGVRCKGRLDITSDGVIDIKTTRHRTLRQIIMDAATYNYHGQVAWYHDGATAAGKIDGRELPKMITVYAPTDLSFVDVAVFSMGMEHETFHAGRDLYKSLLKRYVGCKEANWWPGIAPNTQPWTLPSWKLED